MSRRFSADYTLERDGEEIDLEIEYEAAPRRRATRLDPAEGGVEAITDITCDGKPFAVTPAEHRQIRRWLASEHEEPEPGPNPDYLRDLWMDFR